MSELQEKGALMTFLSKFVQPKTEVSTYGTRVIARKQSTVDRLVFLDDHDPFDVALVKMKLDKMFRSSFFSICEVTEAVDFLKLSTVDTKHTLNRLRLLHCTHWYGMDKNLKELIPEMISEILTEGAYVSVPSGVVSTQ
jgi:hypothetical protein